jgi:hypothetical protein
MIPGVSVIDGPSWYTPILSPGIAPVMFQDNDIQMYLQGTYRGKFNLAF